MQHSERIIYAGNSLIHKQVVKGSGNGHLRAGKKHELKVPSSYSLFIKGQYN